MTHPWNLRRVGSAALGAAAIMVLGLWSPAAAQDGGNRLVVSGGQVSLDDPARGRIVEWRLVAGADPDIYYAELAPGETREICFRSAEASLCRMVSSGGQTDFVIRSDGVDYPTRILARPPAAVFDADYRTANAGRVQILVPEVYELVNVAIALTPTARASRGLVSRDTPYHAAMMERFAPFTEHPLVLALDAELRADSLRYFPLKMNAFAFEYDRDGNIVRSGVYDRTGFSAQRLNELLPHLPLIDAFSRDTNFRAFYRDHQDLYDAQIAYYRDEVDISGALDWLKAEFPAVRPYDSVKIVFSPLVGHSQALMSFSSEGFTELQPHVNFPYPSPEDARLAAQSVAVRRGGILFTEMNHGFIDQPLRPLRQQMLAALEDRAFWATPGTSSDAYATPDAVFLEMMNWGLLSLYYHDRADPADRDGLIAGLEPMMATGRGFPQFPAFNRFLLALYRERADGQTVADLYPQIVDWFSQRAAAPR